MTTVAEAFVTLRPDTSKLGPEIKSGMAAPLKGIATAFAGAFAAVGVTSVVKSVIGSASDMNETLSKSNTIFGSAGKEIEKWASTAASSFGQSKQQALDAASTFGNLFVQLGVGADKAGGMSKQMVELASDFASFHNANPAEVLDAMTAAFRGEYDAVQRFVPTINAAAVEQKALAMTHKATTKELTLQEKALATQALLIEGAGDAMGDFDRTSKGLANRQRILSARFEDIRARIGQALLPVVTNIAGWFADKLPRAMEAAGRAMGALKQIFLVIFKGDFQGGPFAEDSPFIDSLFKLRDKYLPIVQKVAAFLKDNFKPILIGLAAAFVVITSPVTAVVAGLVLLYVKFQVVRDAVQFLVDAFRDLQEWVKKIWPDIQEAITHVINVVKGAWEIFGDELVNIAKILFENVKDVIERAINIIRGVIQFVLALINGDWGKAWDALKGIVGNVLGAIKDTVGNGLKLIREVIEAGLSLLRVGWDKAWDGLSGVVGGVFEVIKRVAISAYNFLVRNFISPFIDSINKIIGAINSLPDPAGILPNLSKLPTVGEIPIPGPGSPTGGARPGDELIGGDTRMAGPANSFQGATAPLVVQNFHGDTDPAVAGREATYQLRRLSYLGFVS